MKTIPTTVLRNFYKLLRSFSSNTQLQISKDFNRGNNYNHLIEMYQQSVEHFENVYDLSIEDDFTGLSIRKELPVAGLASAVNNTNDVVAILMKKNIINVVNDKSLEFKYLDREISPIRTTSAIFDTGKSGKSSGTGGLDFIGINTTDNCPVLGEIKVNQDEDPFFALVQLLTYLSELAPQKARIKHTGLFTTGIKNPDKFYLYILICHTRKPNAYWAETLANTKSIINNILKARVKNIADIALIELTPSSTIERL